MDSCVVSIRSKTSRDGKKTALILTVEKNGERIKYTINEGTYRKIGCPLSGNILSSDDLEYLEERDAHARATARALKILSYADNSEASLKRKLIGAGFGRELSQSVTEEMAAMGYINERDQLDRAIISLANRELLGRYRITARLVGRGYSAKSISERISALSERGDIDFHKSFEQLKSKKLHDAETEEEKIKLLYRYGYRK